MKKRKLILIGLLIWNFNSVFGQNFCFTPSTSSNLSLNSSYQMRSSNNNFYCLKIYFHVIRRSNGTGGQSVESVEEAFNILNQDFNPQNISFNWDSQIDYIDNDSYYSSPTTAIFNVNNHQDGIDIYLYDDSSSAGGRANGVGQSSEFWVSGSYWKTPNNPLTRSHVISHEMGHVLYLWHTHHGTYNEGGNDNPCPELVNGSNSATCGDYVTDTPADPHLQFDVNQSTCEWNSSGTDANGTPYNPDEKNVMSYTDVNCMEYFTEGQGERMRNAISTLPYLQQSITNCSASTCNEKPKITVKLEPMGTNYVAVHMVSSNGADINSQCITSTTWQKISSSGGCYGIFGGSGFEGLGHGNCNSWSVYAKITATNSFGTTTIYRTITPPAPDPCRDSYRIGKTLSYHTYRIIIDPCRSSRAFSLSDKLNSRNNENQEIRVYNHYGNLVFITKKTEFDLSFLRKGIYFIKASINGEIITHKIIR